MLMAILYTLEADSSMKWGTFTWQMSFSTKYYN